MPYLHVLLLGGHTLIISYLVFINVALVIIVIKGIVIVVRIIISMDEFCQDAY